MPGGCKLASATAVLALALALLAPAAAASGAALVVGDSLQVLTAPYLKRHLSGVPLTVNAEGGYNSYQIYDLFEQSYDPSTHSVVVFDAGTNDNPAYPEILAGNLAKVAARIGERCMVVPTIHGLTVEGIGNEGKNRVVESFAASRFGTQTPDWAGTVASHPELMQADDLHPVPAGADRRARLIAAGVRACLAFGSAGPAPREPAIESAPDLPPAGRLARRQRRATGAIAAGLARQIAAEVARRQPLLAAMLTMASSYA